MKVGNLSDLTSLQHKALTTPNTDLLQRDKQSAHTTKWKKGKEVSVQLSVDVGIEPHVFGEDIPVWHVTVTYPKHTRILAVKEWGEFERNTAAELAREALEGRGDTERWSLQEGGISIHYRRPLSEAEDEALHGVLFPSAYLPLPTVEVDPEHPKVHVGRGLKLTVTDQNGNELAVLDGSPTDPKTVEVLPGEGKWSYTMKIIDDRDAEVDSTAKVVDQAWAYDLEIETADGTRQQVEAKQGTGNVALQEALHETAEAWGLPEEEIVRLALEGANITSETLVPLANRVEEADGVNITAGDDSWQTVIDEAAADLVDKAERRVLGNLLSFNTPDKNATIPEATDDEQ